MPTYHGSMYLMSDFLSAVQGTQSNTADIATVASNTTSIASDTGNLPAIKTSAENLDTPLSGVKTGTDNLAAVKTSVSNLDTPISGIKSGTDQISSVATDVNTVAAQTTSAGSTVAASNEAMNNKTLTSVKTSQTMGFLGGTQLSSNFSTSSTSFVDTGLDLASVPNASKILYNVWFGIGSSTGTAYFQIVASSTVLTNWSQPYISGSNINKKDYSGTVTNSSGSTNTVSLQAHADSSSTNVSVKGGTSPSYSMLAACSSTAVIYSSMNALITGSLVLGSCQISAIEFLVISSMTYPTIQICGAGINSNALIYASLTLPQTQAFPNGIPAVVSSAIVDPDLCVVVDYTGALLTVT